MIFVIGLIPLIAFTIMLIYYATQVDGNQFHLSLFFVILAFSFLTTAFGYILSVMDIGKITYLLPIINVIYGVVLFTTLFFVFMIFVKIITIFKNIKNPKVEFDYE